MCGRYANTFTAEELTERFYALWNESQQQDLIKARYNIAPTPLIPVVRTAANGREIVLLKWGLIPSRAKDASIGVRLINARAETLADKLAFRSPYKRHHCLIPASAFYEWKATGGRKQPYYIQMADKNLFGMAALWERWANPDGEPVETCTIIATSANELVGQLHNRMPLIIQPSDYGDWLDATSPKTQELLKPYPLELMTYYAVSTRVNVVRNDDAACLEPV